MPYKQGKKARPYNEPSPTAVHEVRVICDVDGSERTVAVHDKNADQFAARLRKTLRARRKWAKSKDVWCYRIYDADLPDFAVAIDVYEGVRNGARGAYLHIAEYAAPASIDPEKAERRFRDVLALAPVVCGISPAHVFAKQRKRDKGGSQYSLGERPSFPLITKEGGLFFEVDLNAYLDTGLFLDHRTTRMFVGALCQGKRFLNLFAYTGSATVHAAAGGAASTHTVDLSQTYLQWANRNMRINGFTGSQHRYTQGDVMSWLAQASALDERYDVVFVDPPTFSNSKRMGRRTWDVQRDHVELLCGVGELLDDGGVAVFSCNLRSFKLDAEGLAQAGLVVKDVTAQTIPEDFQRNPKIHYCYVVGKR